MKAFDEGNIRSTVDDLLTAENTDWFRLGFNSAPFVDDQDAAYFAIDSWEDAFHECEQFSDDHDPLLVIPSIPGSGKTTFVSQFIAKQDAPAQTHYLKARSIFSLRNLLNAISENFPQFSNLTTNSENFINDLRSAAQEAGPQLLIIDDAQRLSKESLAGLLQILANQDLSDLWLRVILCGEPQLEDRVQSLFDELEFSFTFNTIVLDALDLNETRAYLKHCMLEAGYNEKFPFNKSMVKHIHTLSSGFPGRINRVAQQVLLDMAKNNQINSASDKPAGSTAGLAKHKIKMISLSIVVFLSLVLWYLQQANVPLALHQETYTTPIAQRFIDRPGMKQKQTPSQTGALTQQTKATNSPAKPVDISFSEQRMLSTNGHNHVTKAKPARVTLPTPKATPASNVITTTTTTTATATTNSTTQNTAAQTVNKQASAAQSTNATNTQANQLTLTAQPNVTVQSDVKEQPATAMRTTAASQPAALTAPTNSDTSAATAQTKPINTTPVAPKPAATPVQQSQKSARNKAETGFTLQLLGVHDQAKLQEYIKQMHLDQQAAYFKTELRGTPWYVLVYGKFTTADEAHAAIKSLPAQVQAQKPWVKPLSAIHSPLIR